MSLIIMSHMTPGSPPTDTCSRLLPHPPHLFPLPLPPAPQEIVHPEQFWYTSGAEVELPFNIFGLVAFELFAMHFVEVKRGLDLKTPGSQDQDPLFPGNKLKPHEVRGARGLRGACESGWLHQFVYGRGRVGGSWRCMSLQKPSVHQWVGGYGTRVRHRRTSETGGQGSMPRPPDGMACTAQQPCRLPACCADASCCPLLPPAYENRLATQALPCLCPVTWRS